jgi:hypothetical protein
MIRTVTSARERLAGSRPGHATRLARLLAAVLLVGLGVSSPPLREALIALDPVVGSSLFFVALAGSAVQWLGAARKGGPRRGARRAEAGLARLLGFWALPLSVLAFLAPLLSQWSHGPIGASAAFSALLGHIPFGDAHGHFEGATRLLNGAELNEFSERRPLNAAWLSVLLALGGGHLRFALVAQATLLGLATLAGARVVAGRAGLYPALAFFGLVLGLFRMFVVGVLTEPLGASFACLGLAILLSGRARGSLAVMAVGFACLDAALRTRPGAQLLLPALMLWGVYVMRGRRRRAAAVFAAVLVAGALHTGLVNHLYGSGRASAVSYPAFTLYGLTRDANYERAEVDFGAELARLPDENARARFLYARAWDALREDPRPFVRALAGNELEFVFKLRRELVRLVSIATLTDARQRRLWPSETDWRRDRRLGGAVLLLVLAGFAVHVAASRRGERVFWAAAAGGLAASAPFVFGDTGLRAMTAGLPFVALGVASGLSARGRRTAIGPALATERRTVAASAAAGLALLAASLAGPGLVGRLAQPPEPARLGGLTPARDAVVALRTCPAVLVTNRGQSSLPLPLVEARDLDSWLDLARFGDAGLRQIALPAVVMSCYDHVSARQRLLVARHTLYKGAGPLDVLSLQPLPGDARFGEVLSLAPLP